MVLGTLGEVSVRSRLRMVKRIGLLMGVLFLLGACAETQLLVHTAKRISGQNVQSKGNYKIGKPYRFLKHLFRHETHVFKTQMLSELEHNPFLHRRILAKIFLRMPKKVKEIIYKFFV